MSVPRRLTKTQEMWKECLVLFTFEEEHTLLLIETVFFSKLVFSRVGQDSPYFQPNFIIYSLSETIKIHSMCKKITVTTSNGWDMSAGEYGVYEEKSLMICSFTFSIRALLVQPNFPILN